VSSYHNLGFGSLEFGKAVGAGQTIYFADGEGDSILNIDEPSQFKATIDWEASAGGAINLEGLAADSYSYANGVLDFFHGSKLVDALKINDLYGSFAVSQGTSSGGAGVEIYGTGQFLHPYQPQHGTDLPLHI
jgi:hypothetical protein